VQCCTWVSGTFGIVKEGREYESSSKMKGGIWVGKFGWSTNVAKIVLFEKEGQNEVWKLRDLTKFQKKSSSKMKERIVLENFGSLQFSKKYLIQKRPNVP